MARLDPYPAALLRELFGVFKETRREYWGIQIVNFLDCTFYFAMLTIVSVFLSEDLGLDDKHAGYAVTIFTSATSLMLARWSPESVSVNGQSVPLQQAMLNGQVDYWHSPAAMWLVLGSYALGGCILRWYSKAG